MNLHRTWMVRRGLYTKGMDVIHDVRMLYIIPKDVVHTYFMHGNVRILTKRPVDSLQKHITLKRISRSQCWGL